MNICKKCSSNNVTQANEIENYKYKNSNYNVLINYSLCNSCKREFLTKKQIIANEAIIREAKKKIDGLLNSDEIYSIRKKLDLTQIDASIIFGGGKNAFSKYERSEVTQSIAMDKLLRLASTDRYIFKKLFNLSKINCKFNYTPIKSVNEIMYSKVSYKWENTKFSISTDSHEVKDPLLQLVA